MDKNILNDYIDACALVQETERDIRALKKKRKTIIQTNVSGSNEIFFPVKEYLPAAAFQDRRDDIYLCRRQCASVGRRLAGAPESERRED